MVTTIKLLKQIHDIGFNGVPKNFEQRINIGFHLITVLNVMHTFIQTAIYSWIDYGQVPFKKLLMTHFGIFMSLQVFQDLVGAVLPTLVLAIGVIYLNQTPESIGYRSNDGESTHRDI